MKTFGLSWPVCGKCCEVALFPWLGGPHHCVVKYPEESIADWPLTVAELDREISPEYAEYAEDAALEQLNERLVRAVEGVAHAGGSRIDATLDPDGALELRSDRSDGPEQILSADEALRLTALMTGGRNLFETALGTLRDLAFLNPGLTITVSEARDQGSDGELGSKRILTLHYPRGILDYIWYINRIWNPMHGGVLHFRDVAGGTTTEVAAQWNGRYSLDFRVFIDGVRMSWETAYEDRFVRKIIDGLNQYIFRRGLTSGNPLTHGNVTEGLVLVISIRTADPRSALDRWRWEVEIAPEVSNRFAGHFSNWMLENTEVVDEVIERAIESRDEPPRVHRASFPLRPRQGVS